MKFSLKDSLRKLGLINESWETTLVNSGMYSPEVVQFVKNELEENYKNQDNSASLVRNNVLAAWMCKAVSEMGGPGNMGSKELKSVRHAFSVILRWFIQNNNSPEAAKQIVDKSPKGAFKFAKDQIETKKEKEGEIDLSDIQRWIDNSEIRMIPSSVGEGRVWVEVLNRNWFDAYCTDNSKTFGIACQTRGQGGNEFVGGNYATYTLLGKPKNESSNHFKTLMSIAVDKKLGKFIEIKQAGNQQPGKVAAMGWNDLAEAAVDFILNNPEMRNIEKFVEWGSKEIPHFEVTYGGAGALCFWMKKKPDLFNKLISKKPAVIDYHEALIRNVKGNEFLEAMDLDIGELVQTDPVRFLSRLNVYYGMRGDEVVEALENFDFKSFVNQYGSRSVEDVLPTVIKLVSFRKFKDEIYDLIDFETYIIHSDEYHVRNIIKNLRNKENSPKKANVIISFILDNHKDTLVRKFGGGSKGLVKLNSMFASPRLDQHQNFFIKKGKIYASLDGGRSIEVEDDKLILGRKFRRDFLMKNREWVKDLLPGSENEKEIKFLKFIFINSSEQDRAKGLDNEKDKFIQYYDEQYSKGVSDLPGVMQLARDKELYKTLADSAISRNFNTIKRIAKTSSAVGRSVNKTIDVPIRVYKFDKKELATSKTINDVLKYYIKHSKSQNESKLADAIIALLETCHISKLPKEVVKSYAFDKLSPEKVLKKEYAAYHLYSAYIRRLLKISKHLTFKDSEGEEFQIFSKDDILAYANSDKVKKSVENSRAATTELAYKDLLKDIKSSIISESNMRKYVTSVLESNYRKKKEALKKMANEPIKKKRLHTPQ